MNLTLKSTTALALALSLTGGAALAGMDEARAFLDAEIGDMSVLTREEQEAEMQWFIDAAKQFEGMDIKVVSETAVDRTSKRKYDQCFPLFQELYQSLKGDFKQISALES